ncbi:hypothetical protein D3C81_954150 [compost metagenome]
MAAHRRQAGAGLADVAAQQLQVDDFLHGRHRMAVLGDAHGPAHDHPLGLAVHACGQLDLGQGQARLFDDVFPRGSVHRCQVAIHAAGVLGDEGMVEHRRLALGLGFAFPLQEELGDAAHHRHVAAQGRAEVRGVGRFRAVAEHLERVLRVLETLQATLLERVQADHLGTAFDRLAQRFEHARVVGARVLADDEDCVGVLQVVEHHGALADPEGFRHADAAGLMAHVRTVRKVVGAIGAHEQLVEEGRLVAGPARGVELGLVGGFEAVEVLGDQREGVFPAGFDVVIGGGVVAHRVGQAALVLKPVVALPGQLGDAVAGKEIRIDQAPGGLPVDRLGTVLAELDHAAFRRLAPGTARAVETAVLVGLEHHPQVLEGVFTAQPALGHALQRAPTGGGGVIVFYMFILAHRGFLAWHAGQL